MEHESDGGSDPNWRTLYSNLRIDKGTGGLGNKWTSETIQTTSLLKRP